MSPFRFVVLLRLPDWTITANSITFYDGPTLPNASWSTTWEEGQCTVIALGFWPKSDLIEVSSFAFFGVDEDPSVLI